MNTENITQSERSQKRSEYDFFYMKYTEEANLEIADEWLLGGGI